MLSNPNENWYIILYDLFSRLWYNATCGPFCKDATHLYNGLLLAYFNVFLDFITREPPRVLRNPLIHQPVLRTKYAECNLLFQLIKVINLLKNDPCDTILKKVHLRTHTYKGFAFNVTHVFLNAYDPICRLRVCYVCN